eukprot:5479726-Amphidinium_carterae.1
MCFSAPRACSGYPLIATAAFSLCNSERAQRCAAEPSTKPLAPMSSYNHGARAWQLRVSASTAL